MSKITDTATALAAKLLDKRSAIARAEEEAAELERAAAWAAGAERRDRLASAATQARTLADDAEGTNAQLHDAARDLAAATQRLVTLAATHNAQLAQLRQQIAAEGVRQHTTGTIPPSPTDAGIGLNGAAVIVGDAAGAVRVRPIDPAQLVALTTQAGRTGDVDALTEALAKVLRKTREDVPTPAGPFWRHRDNGSVHASTSQPYGCDPITRAEFLAESWGIALRDLPADVLDELSAVERGHLAHQLLPVGDK
jgi:hypothetical protein